MHGRPSELKWLRAVSTKDVAEFAPLALQSAWRLKDTVTAVLDYLQAPLLAAPGFCLERFRSLVLGVGADLGLPRLTSPCPKN